MDLSRLLDPQTGNPIPIFDPAVTAASFGSSVQQFDGNIIPVDRVSAAGKAVLQNFFPAPNLPGDPGSHGWSGNFLARQIFRSNFNNADNRLDMNLSQKDRISVFYHYGDYQTLTGDRFAGHIPVDGGGDGDAGDSEDARDQSISFTQTHSFSSRWLNEFRFGYSRFRLDQLSLLNDRDLSSQFGMANVNVPGFPATASFPEVYLQTGFYTGGSTFKPLLFLDNNIQISESISGKVGHHDFKAGFDYRRLRSNPNFSLFPTGFQYYGGQFASLTSDPTFSFDDPAAYFENGGSDVADLLLGLPLSVSIGLQLTNPTAKSWEMHFYGQDSWQVTPRIVLSYGLRYEFQKPYGEIHNQLSNFDPTTLSVLIAGAGGNSGTLVQDDRNNFSPRLGISYQFNRKTVLRAGYGLYYTPENDARSDALTKNYPFAVQQLYSNSFYLDPPFPYVLDTGINRISTIPLAAGTSSIAAADIMESKSQGLFYLDPHFRTGYSELYNLTLERELTPSMSWEVGYVGSVARKLPYAVGDVNRGQRISDLLGEISAQFPEGNGHYHSLQSKLTKRFSSNMSFLASYTWSKNIDNGPAPFNLGKNLNRNNQPQDPFNLGAEVAVADTDVTHNLVVSGIYELPFGRGKRFFAAWHGARQAVLGGWQLNTIFVSRTGLPVNVVQHANNPVNPGLRPNLIGDPILSRSERTLDHYFNKDAFCVPVGDPDPDCPALGPNGAGSAGRNPVRGPGFVNFDSSLFKDFAFGEVRKLQLRFEAFNLLNTPHFGNPEGDFGSGANFGRIRGTVENPRILQFAAKFLF